jgi:hypothetical protein
MMRIPNVHQEIAMRAPTLAAFASALALAACDKAPEKLAEKSIESAMSKDGTQAKVNLSDGSMKVTTTDAAGKTTQLEVGKAQVTEADVGVPFYPGSKPAEGAATRVAVGDAVSVQTSMHSDDAPDKVAAFYRDKLKAMADGKQMMDMSSGEGAMLSVVDDKTKSAIQVHIGKAEKGSDIMISSTRGGAK